MIKINLYDPLFDLLGSSTNGLMTYTYEDVVKLTGHSCPTASGAFLMVKKGLEELYGDETPLRGGIKAVVQGKLGDGVVGVISSVVSYITGATDISGFHGLGGNYDRRGLLSYDENLDAQMLLQRVDTGKSVKITYNPQLVPPAPQMQQLMQMVLSGNADEKIKKDFQDVWQGRVQNLLAAFNTNPNLITCKHE